MHHRLWLSALFATTPAFATEDICDEGGGSVEVPQGVAEADQRLDGLLRYGALGTAVANVGDVDGDGWEDLAVGLPGDRTQGLRSGAVLLFLSDGAPTSLASAPVRIVGTGPGDNAGSWVAPAGDVDGDGYADLLVGALPSARGPWRGGVVWVVRGGPALPNLVALSGQPALTGVAGDAFGAAAVGAGDLDGDGYGDVAVGAPASDAGGVDSGAVYVFHGPFVGDRSSAAASAVWAGESANDRAGTSIAPVDGGLLIGAPQWGPGLAADGAVYRVGLATGVRGLAAADVTYTGSGNERFGWSVASAGDTDGDGEPELWVGARLWSSNKRGAAYLLPLNPAAGRHAATGLSLAIFRGRDGSDRLGTSVAGGDLNGDGLSDAILGADAADGSAAQTGAVWTLLAPFGGEVSVSALRGRHAGETSGALTGASVAVLSDLDGDGFGDVLVGSPGANPHGLIGAGAVSVLRGGADEVDLQPFWPDSDGDGWGGAAVLEACAQPDGYVTRAGDCDDGSAAYHPEVRETSCTDGNDYSCDGAVGAVDNDHDGVLACAGDCDDADPLIGPTAGELCGNGVDDDCNGLTDDPSAVDAPTWRPDGDQDGYGGTFGVRACSRPALFLTEPVTVGGDCRDDLALVHPGQPEACNEADDDCDGLIDEDAAAGASEWYADADGDGYGDRRSSAYGCSAPAGYTADVTDCDDGDSAVFPGAAETCDALDNDCDGVGYLGGPVPASSTLWSLAGEGAGRLGLAMARVPGDDGRDALAVSMPDSADGTVVVLDLPASGARTLASTERCRITAARSRTGFGAALAAGDFDGDGQTDLAVGAPSEVTAFIAQGAVRVFYGPLSGALSATDAGGVLVGVDGDDRVGASLAAADLDGDGDDELIIGAPGSDLLVDHGGAVVVVPGGTPRATLAARPTVAAFPAIGGADVRDELGGSVTVLGDADGDGLPELAAAAMMGGLNDAGYVAVASLLPAGLVAGPVVTGPYGAQRLGRAIAGGDTDGDGFAELIVSSALGRVWVAPLGGSGVVSALATAEISGPSGQDLGAGLSAYDADQDGLDDLLIGAPGRGDAGSGAGALLVLYATELAAEVDVTALESRGRVEAGTTFPTFSAANAGVPEGALVLGPAAGAAMGMTIVPGLRGLDPQHPEIAVAAPQASARAGLVVGVATGRYGLDVAGDGDGDLIDATGVQIWPDRDLDGQAPLGDPGAFVCEMHAPQSFATPGAPEQAFVLYAALAMDCDDTDASIRRGAPDRPRDGVDSNCDGSDAAVLNFPPVALRCAVTRPDGAPVTATDRVQTGDPLRALTLGMDPEGAEITWSYAWSDPVAGVLAATSDVGDGVVVRDRLLTLECAPADADQAGAAIHSASVPVRNAPPVVSSCGLSPHAPTTSSTVAAAPVTVDLEGDPLTLSYTWRRNGAVLTDVTGSTLDPSYTLKGDDLQVTCAATDGRDPADPRASAVVRVVNEAPALTSVTLTVNTGVAYERSALSCAATATDADGDAISYVWSWRTDGHQVAGANTQTLTGASFGRDDRVTCHAVPRDSLLAGAIGASNQVVVQNTAPTLAGAQVVTVDGAPVTELASLRCDMVGLVDDDGDTVTTTTTWSVNGVPAVTQDLINGFWYRRDDLISCAVTPTDDREAGPTGTSSAVVVENSPATAPDAVITPVVADTEDALQCAIALGAVDPDEDDVISYTASWWYDDVAWTGAVTTTAFAGDTIPASAMASGLWTCVIEADDGADVVASDPTDRHVFEAWNRRNVRMGLSHACYVLSDRSLRCQGLGVYGQLGTDLTGLGLNLGDAAGEVGSAQARVDLPVGLGVELLAVGSHHTCIVGTDGEVRCWGKNDHGQLGLGHADNIGDDIAEMGAALDAVSLPAHSGIAQIEGGNDTTCVRTATGEVYCWGYNGQGQCGQGHALDIGAALGDVAALSPVNLGGHAATDLTVGGDFVCALLDDATIRCWGKNGLGQLGQGGGGHRGDDPGEMAALATTQLGTGTVVDIDAGNNHACGRFADGRVKCWGQNSDGQLGQGLTGTRGDGPGEMGDSLPVVSLGTGLLAVDLTAGSSNSCVMFSNGAWKCWGSNAGGGNANNVVLGGWGDSNGEMGDTLTVRSLPSGAVAESVELGYQGGCAVSTCGTLHCWGENSAGQAGVGTASAQRVPSAAIGLPAGTNVVHRGACGQ